jgi:outer membrane protein TolC
MRKRSLALFVIATVAVGAFDMARAFAGEPLGFRAAMRLAADRSPAIRAASHAAQGFERARLVSDPLVLLPAQMQLTAGVRRFPEDRPSAFEGTAQLVQPLPLRPLGGSRARLLASARDLAVARVAEARAAVVERAAHAWLDAAFAERSLALRQRARDEARSLTKLARSRLASGISDEAEVALASADEAVADGDVLDAEGMVTESRLALGALLGDAWSGAELDTGDAPPEAALPSDDDALRAMRARHPALERARRFGEQLAREADYVHAQFANTLGVGLTGAREGTGELVGGALLSIPIALSSPGQADTLRARTEAEEADLFREVEELELVRQLRVALHEHTHTREVLGAANAASRALEHAYRVARAQVGRGASDFALAALARQRLLLGQDRALHAAAAVAHADVRLMALQGALTEGTKP